MSSPERSVGRTYRSTDHYEVGREEIREFARAVQDFHPAHWDDAAARALGYPGLIAPVTFASSVATVAQRALLRTALQGYDPARLLHVEQEIHCHRALAAGDRLTHEITVDSWRTIAGGDLIALTTVISDHDTGPVQTVHTTLAGRGGAEGETVGDIAKTLALQDLPLPLTAAADLATSGRAFAVGVARGISREILAGQRFPPCAYRLTRGEVVNYAGVSGDVNPLHWSDDIASATGTPGVLAHGMLTMGLGAAALSSWCGDPTGLLDYSVVFANPVHLVGRRTTDIEFTGTVHASGADRATVALTAQCDGTPVLGGATATFAVRT
ncbi:FAS1-like dehydratase domain-containing protein [Nocardia sp. GP40]|uniref:FAS1-like dehydratase domain-containing protein n=1 Tax=Nocardia sp. GP40 TaxID=3156268 RepID=UPI003D2550A0